MGVLAKPFGFVLITLGVCATVVTVASCGSRAARTPPNLLLITIDTLRADRIGCYGDHLGVTPTLDRLCAEGWKLDPVFASAPLTLPSHASLMTGKEPPEHGVRANGTFALNADHQTLATILHGAGLTTAAFVAAYPLDRRFGLARGFDEYDDHTDTWAGGFHYRERPAGEVVDAAISWLRPRLSTRFFVWIHLYDPHEPYLPPEPYRSRFANDLYRGEVAYADASLARCFDLIKTAGRWDDTVVVATGDHGESLGEHREDTHGFFVYDSTLRIPLIIKPAHGRARPPSLGGGRLIDVLPTALDLLGIKPPAGIPGQDLLIESAPTMAYAESLTAALDYNWAPLFALRVGRLKYIAAPRPELYDTDLDPGELHDLAKDPAHGNDVTRLGTQLDRIRRSFDASATKRARVTPDHDSSASLEALGYVSGSNDVAAVVNLPAKDPKDMINTAKEIDAVSGIESGRLPETIRRLRALAASDRTDNLIHRRLGTALEQARDWSHAAEEYERAMQCGYVTDEIVAGTARAHLRAGAEADRRGDTVGAGRAFNRAVELTAGDAAAWEARGVWLARQGRLGAARADFNRSVALAPERWQPHYQIGMAALKANDTRTAVMELQAAVARGASADPGVLFALAEAYRRERELTDAVGTLRKFLAVPGVDPAWRAAGQRMLDQLTR